MGELGSLVPSAPPIPVRAPAPTEELRQEIRQAEVVARGQTFYCGEVSLAWLGRLTAWFRRLG